MAATAQGRTGTLAESTGLLVHGLYNAAFVLVSGDFRLALLIWSANGVFQAMGWTPLMGALGRWVAAGRSARVIASFGSCFVAGTALTFAASGFIIERGGVDAVFMAAALVLVPIGVVWWIGVRDQVPGASPVDQGSGSIFAAIRLLPPAAAIGVAYVALIVWTPAYFVEVHGVSVGRAGLLSSVMPAVSIAVTILLGRWFRVLDGPAATLRGGTVLLLTAVALAMVTRSTGLASGFATVAAATALVGASSSVVLGLYPRISSPGGVSLATGVFAFGFNLGGGAGSPVMGNLVGRGDWTPPSCFWRRRCSSAPCGPSSGTPGRDLRRHGKELPMARHRAVMDLGRDEWMAALGIAEADIPHAVILEGSWWREQRTAWRLSRLEDVRELAFPDMFLGYHRGRPVVYSCVYAAPRAVEPAHLFGLLGTSRGDDRNMWRPSRRAVHRERGGSGAGAFERERRRAAFGD